MLSINIDSLSLASKKQVNVSRALSLMARKMSIFLLSILLLSLLASKSEGQKSIIAPSASTCTSHCETCPVVCSPPQPPPKHHHSPPALPQPPSPPVEPNTMQHNSSYPYYYFIYTSKAVAPSFHLQQGFSILFVVGVFAFC